MCIRDRLDMVVINILIAAELIIAPVKVGGYEIEALQNLEEQIEDLRDINPDLRIKALMTCLLYTSCHFLYWTLSLL